MADSNEPINRLINAPSMQHMRFSTPREIVIPVMLDLAEAAATYLTIHPQFAGYLLGARIEITEVVTADSTAPVVSVDIATVEVLALTVADEAAVGSVTSSDDLASSYAAGAAIAVGVKTAGIDASTETGQGYVVLTVVDRIA